MSGPAVKVIAPPAVALIAALAVIAMAPAPTATLKAPAPTVKVAPAAAQVTAKGPGVVTPNGGSPPDTAGICKKLIGPPTLQKYPEAIPRGVKKLTF